MNTLMLKLGALLGVSAPTASGLVERMVEKGLISRSDDVDDRRVRRLHPTEAGLDTMRRLDSMFERALAVAEFLRKVGLRSEQIGVSGLGGGKPGASASPAAPTSRRVEIFVMGKKTPIVGWDDAAAGRF